MTHWNQNSKSTSCNLTRTRNHFGLFHLRNKACLFEQHNCATFAVFAYDCICRAAKSETSIITLWDYGIVSKAGYTSNLCNFHAEQHVRWHMGHGALGDPIRTHLNKGLRQDSSAEGARPWTRPCRQVETRPERQKLQPRSPHWQRRLDRTNHDNKQLSYGSKIGYQSTNKMCIFAVNRPFLGLVIWARPKESTGRTQRTLDCFHAELVIKSLERLVDFRFFQTSKHRKHRLRLSQGCEKKNWCEKTPSSRYTAPRGKWRLQAPEKVSLQNHAALPCSAMLFQSESEEPPLWDPLEFRWPPFDQNVFMLKKGHGSPKAVLSISACGHSIGSWVNDVVSELGKWLIQLIPPISGKSFGDGIWNMSFNCVML